jgi:hypothetical protein
MRWLSLVVYFKVYFFDMFFKSQKIPKTLSNLFSENHCFSRHFLQREIFWKGLETDCLTFAVV